MRKKWLKPECRRVRLVPEEILIKGCKVPISSGPLNVSCQGGGPPCQGAGS